MLLQPFLDFSNKSECFAFLGFYNALFFVGPHVEPKKIEPVFDVNDFCFLSVELQAAFAKEVDHCGQDCVDIFSTARCDHEVVCIPNVAIPFT